MNNPNTTIPQHLSASELVKPCTHCSLLRKNVSALGTCLRFAALARTCMIHNTAPQVKTLWHSVLLGFGTCSELRNKLTSAEIPLHNKTSLKHHCKAAHVCVSVIFTWIRSAVTLRTGYPYFVFKHEIQILFLSTDVSTCKLRIRHLSSKISSIISYI